MIQTQHLTMSQGSKLLFHDVSLTLTPGRRYGLVGANGTGKSTLMRLLCGEEQASEGTIASAKDARVGWLKQDQYLYEDSKMLDVVLRGRPALWEALEEKDALLQNETWTEAAGYRIAELEEVIGKNGGYTAEEEAADLLCGLGIPLEKHSEPLGSLSGGYKLRVLLARALFDSPEILLLDEPTNYLDIVTIAWLEQYLCHSFSGLLVVTSHDQQFLNSLCTHILDIDYGDIRMYTGNYDAFVAQKQLVVEQKQHQLKHAEKRIEQMQTFIDRFKSKPSKARQCTSREKQIAKVEIPDIDRSSRVSPSFRFVQKRHSGRKVVEANGICKSYDGNHVLEGVDVSVERGEKVVFTGPNGIGKSTLIKILSGVIAADEGNVEWGHETAWAYAAQDPHDIVRGTVTVFDWLYEQVARAEEMQVRRVLGQMLFSQDEIYKKVEFLSGGESMRLQLAKVALEHGNVLILDEPTNHLDLEGRNALARALRAFDGTVLLVSHDRHFVEQMATRIVDLGALVA